MQRREPEPIPEAGPLVPRWDSKLGKEIRSIQVGIDGFRAVAESSGSYAGNEDPIYDGEKEITYGKESKKLTVPLTAKVTVYKLMSGERMPFSATARWEEYYPGEKWASNGTYAHT